MPGLRFLLRLARRAAEFPRSTRAREPDSPAPVSIQSLVQPQIAAPAVPRRSLAFPQRAARQPAPRGVRARERKSGKPLRRLPGILLRIQPHAVRGARQARPQPRQLLRLAAILAVRRAPVLGAARPLLARRPELRLPQRQAQQEYV